MIGKVQDCGCISLSESLQEQTGLFPGATYEIEVTEEGGALFLRPLERGGGGNRAMLIPVPVVANLI
jgi:hypothetical protein